MHNQAVQPIGWIVDGEEHPPAVGFDEGSDAFLRGAGNDVLLLELAVGLEEDHRHLGREVVVQVRADLLIRAFRVAGDALQMLFELRVVVDLEMIRLVHLPLEGVVVDVVLAVVRDEPCLRGGGHGLTDEQNTRGSDAQGQAGARPGGRPTTRNLAHAHKQYLEQERALNGLILPCRREPCKPCAERVRPKFWSSRARLVLRGKPWVTAPGYRLYSDLTSVVENPGCRRPAVARRTSHSRSGAAASTGAEACRAVARTRIGSGGWNNAGRARVYVHARRSDMGMPGVRPAAKAGGESARDAAFEAEALASLDSLYRTALRLTRVPADAEDLVQDTYLKAFRAADSFEPGTNLRAWLFTILHNSARNRARDRARERVTVDSDIVERAADVARRRRRRDARNAAAARHARPRPAGGDRCAARGLPPGGLATGRGRVFLRRDRRHARDPGGHRDVAHFARPADAVQPARPSETCQCLIARPSIRFSPRMSTESFRASSARPSPNTCARVPRAARAWSSSRPSAIWCARGGPPCSAIAPPTPCARSARCWDAGASRGSSGAKGSERTARTLRTFRTLNLWCRLAHASRAARPGGDAAPCSRRRVALSDHSNGLRTSWLRNWRPTTSNVF